ncbi:hypothetical protein CBL_20556 [Carabus blaptoides fortunei]
MDNSPYHSVKLEKKPTTAWKKADIQEYLQGKRIEVADNLLKVELMDMAWDYLKCNPVGYRGDEMGKGFVAARNQTFKLGDVRELFHAGLAQVTPGAPSPAAPAWVPSLEVAATGPSMPPSSPPAGLAAQYFEAFCEQDYYIIPMMRDLRVLKRRLVPTLGRNDHGIMKCDSLKATLVTNKLLKISVHTGNVRNLQPHEFVNLSAAEIDRIVESKAFLSLKLKVLEENSDVVPRKYLQLLKSCAVRVIQCCRILCSKKPYVERFYVQRRIF